MSYAVRELPREEWNRVAGVGPWLEGGLPDPEHSRLIVVESDGEIVGTWAAMDSVHLEGVWIDPAHRHHLQVVVPLMVGMFALLHDHNVKAAFTYAADETTAAMLEKLGFTRLPYIPFVRELKE